MNRLKLEAGQVGRSIAIMQEVAVWGRQQGLRVWPPEWLTREELVTDDAQPENFYVGTLNGEDACSFILQWRDREYWPDAPEYEAAYLHKFCVRRKFAHRGMTRLTLECIKAECRERNVRLIRLDTGAKEPVVQKIYLDAGFEIVKILERNGVPVMFLYELKV